MKRTKAEPQSTQRTINSAECLHISSKVEEYQRTKATDNYGSYE